VSDSPVVAVIPVRYGSTRFPAKALARETGKYLVQHVYEQVVQAERLSRVLVAADDARIVDAVESFGGEAVITSADHANGTSRIAEVARSLPPDCEIIVNVQGDEPEIEPAHIDLAIESLTPEVQMATLASPFAADESLADPHIVKVVLDQHKQAIYFSRARIPHQRDPDSPAPMWFKHVGLYVYRRSFLLRYVEWEPTPLEQAERLEQLRVLEHGCRIGVAIAKVTSHGIDTPAQYEAFVKRELDRQRR